MVLDRSGEPLPLPEQRAYAAKMAEIAQAEGVRARARQQNLRPSRGAVERMRDLAAGGFIPAAAPADERQAAAEEEGIARAAEIALHGKLNEIASEPWSRTCSNEAGYSLQGNRKTTEGDSHPDRDARFGYINTQVTTAVAEQQPVISVDTKKRNWSAISVTMAANIARKETRKRSGSMTS